MDDRITSITPFLTVADAKKAAQFYGEAFGAREMDCYEMSAGKFHFKMGIEKALFFVGDEEPQFDNLGPDTKAHCPVRIILQTPDADALYNTAVQLGATAICPMTTEAQWRIGKLKDPFGHIWEIGYLL